MDDIQGIINNHSMFQVLKDALYSNHLTIIAANQFPMVGKYIPMASNEYKSAYDLADIVWLKGQGNFQTMPLLNHYYRQYNNKYEKIFLSFVVKAPIIQYCLKQVCAKSYLKYN